MVYWRIEVKPTAEKQAIGGCASLNLKVTRHPPYMGAKVIYFGVRRLDCALIPAARRRIKINAKVDSIVEIIAITKHHRNCYQGKLLTKSD